MKEPSPWGQQHLILSVLILSIHIVKAVSALQDNYYLRSRPLLEESHHSTRLLEEELPKCSIEECEVLLNVTTKEECEEEANPFSSVPFAVQIILIIILIGFSALFSGLTLGLMGLDKTGLEIVMEGDDEKNAEYARKIYPVRKNGNLLLCTLLLGNVAVNALLSILTAANFGGLVGFLASTFLIVIFGEILPQAACSRYALEVGSRAIPLVKVIMFILFPVAAPLAWALDKLLGKELATTYSSAEMLKLLQIHVQEQVLDQDTAVAMTGALKYKDILVKDVMTPLDNAFMLSADEKLNFETIAKIFKTGYSRIPVYEIDKNNVIGLLMVKDLVFIDPEDSVAVNDFVEIFGRGVHVVWVDDNLGDVLRELKKGKSHMALVRDVNNEDETQDPYYEIKGIITLEDIIEEILGDEIVDETDAFVDRTHSQRVARAETFEWARLRLLDTKIVDETLSYDETRAVVAHLWKNYSDIVSLMTEHQLEKLISETHVSILPTAEQKVGHVLPKDLLYERGVPVDFCTLVLSGKVTVLAGTDQFRSDVSSWSLLASGALLDSSYQSDFTAFVSHGPCRCLCISYARFAAAVDASALERHSSHPSLALRSDEATSGPMILPIQRGAQKTEEVEPQTELDTSERTRRSKLLAALQMVRSKKGTSTRTVTFDSKAKPDEQSDSSKPKAPSPKSDDESLSTTPKKGSTRPFAYIGSSASGSHVTPTDTPEDEK